MTDETSAGYVSELRRAGCSVELVGVPLNGNGEPTHVRIVLPDPDEVLDGIEKTFGWQRFKMICFRAQLAMQEND